MSGKEGKDQQVPLEDRRGPLQELGIITFIFTSEFSQSICYKSVKSVVYGCHLSQSTPNEFLPSGLAPRVRMTSLLPVGLMVQPSTSVDHSAGETKAFPYAIRMLLNFAHFSLLKSEFQGSKIFQFPNTGYTGVWDGGKEETPGGGRRNPHLMKVPGLAPVLTLVEGYILYRLMMGVCEPLEIKFRRMLNVHAHFILRRVTITLLEGLIFPLFRHSVL